MLPGDGSRIKVYGKWGRDVTARLITTLTWNQQGALESHMRNLTAGRPIMEKFNFKEGETAFFRGQPETEFESLDPRNRSVRVSLTGLSHWQIRRSGVPTKGTRYVENLQSSLLKVIEWDDDLEV